MQLMIFLHDRFVEFDFQMSDFGVEFPRDHDVLIVLAFHSPAVDVDALFDHICSMLLYLRIQFLDSQTL